MRRTLGCAAALACTLSLSSCADPAPAPSPAGDRPASDAGSMLEMGPAAQGHSVRYEPYTTDPGSYGESEMGLLCVDGRAYTVVTYTSGAHGGGVSHERAMELESQCLDTAQ